MKRGSTLLLRFFLILIALVVATLCIFILPMGIMSDNTGLYRPLLIGMYIPAIPFFIALFQIFKLLNSIDQNKAFSKASIKSLQYIKYCTAIIGGLYALILPYIYFVAEKDDAPGVILLGLIFTGAPISISVMSAVLQKLLNDAISLKSENSLTV